MLPLAAAIAEETFHLRHEYGKFFAFTGPALTTFHKIKATPICCVFVRARAIGASPKTREQTAIVKILQFQIDVVLSDAKFSPRKRG